MPDIDFQRIELNIIPKQGDEPVIFYASQYETTRPFIADLMWGESEFAPGGDCWAEIDIRKNDDNLVVITDDVAIDNNEVSVILPVQALTCIGKNLGQVKIYAGEDQLIAALNFILEVQPDPLAGGVTSETAIDNLESQIAAIVPEVVGEDYYDKTEVNALLADKADVSDLPDMSNYYTKSQTYSSGQIDYSMNLKADRSELDDYALKTWVVTNFVDAAYLGTHYYNKAQVDNLLTDMLPEASASGAVASVNVAMVSNITYTADENATKIMKTSGNASLAGYIKNIYNGNYGFVNLGDLNWVYGGGVFTTYDVNDFPTTASGWEGLTNFKCSEFSYSDWDLVDNPPAHDKQMCMRYVGGQYYTRVSDSDYTDAATFKAAMNGAYLIYELETPVTPSITDTDFANICTSFDISGSVYAPADTIYTSIGDNNFFGDVGNISVSAKDTIQHYIDTRL